MGLGGLGVSLASGSSMGGGSTTLYKTAVKPLLALLSPPQRIEAAALGPTLSYFGRSVDGRLDLDGDGLVDLAVGAQGAAVLLR